MSQLIFEIGCEEMPARFVLPAMQDLKSLALLKLINQGLYESEFPPVNGKLPEAALQDPNLQVFGTPRRLALIVKGLKDHQEDKEETALGPPVKAAYDGEGNPTKAALGFAKSQGVEVGELTTVATNKGDRLAAVKTVPGRPAKDILSELLPDLVEALHFPKTMRWGSGSFRFARPLHWFLALLDGQVIPFELTGIASGDTTRGHRFLAPGAIQISGADEYLPKLEEARVIVDREARRQMVANGVLQAAQAAGGSLVSETAERLLEENTDLVEQATACCGSFDQEFLEVPRPVIIEAMAGHQRYFALEDENGSLLPAFIAVNNTEPKDLAVVTRGHQKVLRARLADAAFFLQEDRKKRLIDFLEDLKPVTYHAKLGSSFDKVERFTALAVFLAEEISLFPKQAAWTERTARLAKCDLATGMVGEFPSLQGVIGTEYARLDQEEDEVAEGIMGHYMPVNAEAPLPQGFPGVLVGIADRLDTICGLFGIGQIPSGTADPYGLRRAAIAVIRLVSEKKLVLSLDRMLDQALLGMEPWLEREADEVKADITKFFATRFAGIMAERGCPTDVAQAVLAAGLDDLSATAERAEALAAVKDTPEFAPLAIGLKRVRNILKKEAAQVPDAAPDPALMSEPAEKALHQAFSGLSAEAAELFSEGDFAAFLGKVSALKEPIDTFFDDVMVMVEDEAVRQNRLALLKQLADLFGGFARFEHLQLV